MAEERERQHRDVLVERVRETGAKGGLMVTLDADLDGFRIAFESLTPAEVRRCLVSAETYLKRIEQVIRHQDKDGREQA